MKELLINAIQNFRSATKELDILSNISNNDTDFIIKYDGNKLYINNETISNKNNYFMNVDILKSIGNIYGMKLDCNEDIFSLTALAMEVNKIIGGEK